MALAGGEDVALGIEVDPCNGMAGGLGDLAEKRPLAAPVALAERMDGVDLGVVVRQAVQELLAALAVETVLVGEVCEQCRQVGADVSGSANKSPPLVMRTARSSPAHG